MTSFIKYKYKHSHFTFVFSMEHLNTHIPHSQQNAACPLVLRESSHTLPSTLHCSVKSWVFLSLPLCSRMALKIESCFSGLDSDCCSIWYQELYHTHRHTHSHSHTNKHSRWESEIGLEFSDKLMADENRTW